MSGADDRPRVRPIVQFPQHPLSAAFPPMSDEAMGELRADIAANGLHSPVCLFQGQVLDGWHRYSACKQVGVQPNFVEFTGDFHAAMQFVVSANLLRRHLDTSQRAMIAARFATIPHGGDRKSQDQGAKSPLDRQTVAGAAAAVNVGDRAVKDARVVLNQASPETIAKVESGEVTVSKAARQIRAANPRPRPVPKPAVTASGYVIRPVTLDELDRLPPAEQQAFLEYRNPKAGLNRQQAGEDDNLIDWAFWTWNPVTGCLHDCPYCYARDIANHFAGGPAFPNGFTPTLHPDRLSAPLVNHPRASDDEREGRIFAGSMSDLFGKWVPAELINAMFNVIREAPQWEFLMLTKFPARMAEFDFPENVWAGVSVDCQDRVKRAEEAFRHVNARVKWISAEPMLEPLRFEHLDRFNRIAIGGASPSNKTPRWIPKFEWLGDLMRQANAAGCAIYTKSNLYLKEELDGERYIFTDEAPAAFKLRSGRVSR